MILEFKVVICDESHYLKNWTAQRTKAITPIIKQAARAILLSGTPAVSRPTELYPQISAILPNKFPAYGGFAERYCNSRIR